MKTAHFSIKVLWKSTWKMISLAVKMRGQVCVEMRSAWQVRAEPCLFHCHGYRWHGWHGWMLVSSRIICRWLLCIPSHFRLGLIAIWFLFHPHSNSFIFKFGANYEHCSFKLVSIHSIISHPTNIYSVLKVCDCYNTCNYCFLKMHSCYFFFANDFTSIILREFKY